MFVKCIKLSVLASLLLSSSLFSNDGFDEDEFSSDELIEVVKIEKKDDLTIYGSLTGSADYSYQDKHTISSSKLSTNIKLEYVLDESNKIKTTFKAYKDNQTNKDNDQYVDFNELILESTFSNGIDTKFGRQIVVWGKSDNIRITDILNPMDNTRPGMVDIEDLRLGRAMTKLDYYINNNWAVSGILLHENRYSLMPELGSDYYMPLPIPNAPSNSIANTGIALSANANFEGQDIAFYYSNQYIDNTNYKSNMIGTAYNKVIDSFLIKTELAYFDNYDTSLVDSKIDSLIGLEYNGIDEGSISIEIANKDDEIQYAVRYTQSFFNQTLDLTTLYSGFGKELDGGGFLRAWFEYDIDDSFSTEFGVISYQGGTKTNFELIKNNDRLFTSLKYSF
ncbi:MAG: hypothetical protein HOF69_02125 [Campylobacteraceae bacterium]|jgi:hypothetical protein|nr:hypothetical protein [Campylobacteraceae bacterium]MBT3882042.1 hypothetical protein [Campylobacteraceae bacterium]MBT4030051.1 hypothetical protein [Campylobacteraceae bacterium]MBT4179580.1 hypothetical protein [Campylobacteraceae bacterium]MBT4572544.1 hypothetical protein [Campylobacteraceae bacterium]